MSDSTHVGRPRSRLFRTGHAYADIAALLAAVEPKGVCLDLPAGTGVNIDGIRAAGFEPLAADLFPENAAHKGVRSEKVDFTRPLPFADASCAAVLCSEGIEHCPTQLQLLREFARVLQPGGTLLLTTPNVLNLRARLAALLTGHKSFRGAAVSEVTQVRETSDNGGIYIGHVFLVSYLTLRFMLRLAGFERLRATTAKYSGSAVCLAPFMWLPVQLATRLMLRKVRRVGHPEVAAEITAHMLSPALLFGKKLILLAQKPGPA